MMQPASDFMQHRESSPPQPEHFPKGCTDRAILLLLCSGFINGVLHCFQNHSDVYKLGFVQRIDNAQTAFFVGHANTFFHL